MKTFLIVLALYYGILTSSVEHQPTVIRFESMLSEDKNLLIVYLWNLQYIVQIDILKISKLIKLVQTLLR